MTDVATTCPAPARRRGLRPAERVELALIAGAIGAAAALASGLAWSVPLGALVGYAAAVLLGQGLVRDVARLVARRLRGQAAPAVTLKLVCLCAESSVGVLLVTVGLALTLVGVDQPVVVTTGGLTGGLAALLLFGFVAKDWVLVLRRVEDHATIAVGAG